MLQTLPVTVSVKAGTNGVPLKRAQEGMVLILVANMFPEAHALLLKKHFPLLSHCCEMQYPREYMFLTRSHTNQLALASVLNDLFVAATIRRLMMYINKYNMN